MLQREKRLIACEKQSRSTLLEDIAWPELETQQLFIEMPDICKPVPKSCVAITLDIVDDRDLWISRLDSDGKNLVLKLPLERQSSQDTLEEEFTFQLAKEELQQIIKCANETSHSAKDILSSEGKSLWWKSRKELDQQLAILLENIERIWFGGFKGLLGRFHSDKKCFSRFETRFTEIFEKHFQSKKADTSITRIHLDSNLLDLFIGLGSPDRHPQHLGPFSELLEDLIYFISDSYRLHGNPLNLDEADLDEVVLELEEALRSYHVAARSPVDHEHVVLIPDKSLQCFPWESLPCLRKKSVSRLPSLSALHDRLTDGQWPHVNRNSGFTILNPGGDLKHTQQTFQPCLEKLPGWDMICNRAPTVLEYEDALARYSIFLYFGHGGGEQYIKAQQIKRLDTCALSILMGCSSGILSDQGDFDPVGTPNNYLTASCPALIGNLWDVTDKDIDRFSWSMLQKWGLLKSTSEDADSKVKMSLSEAAAQSRDSCFLKYLNGAAPVVYGVPVYLN